MYYTDIEEEALREFELINSSDTLEAFRIKYLGRSGIVAELFTKLALLPKEERPQAGRELNTLKSKCGPVANPVLPT